jgi:urease accessory protein
MKIVHGRDSAASADPLLTANHEAVLPWLPALLQAADSFYPTGSYAHSFGLEGLVNEGVVRDCETLRQFIQTSVLPTLERSDLPLVAHAWRALAERNWALIGDLTVLASALKTAKEARLASENIGRQRAELLAKLQPNTLATEYIERAAAANWPHAAPLSAALEAVVFNAPLEAALSSYAYSTVSSIVAAAMKLLRIGQNASQALISETIAALPASISAAQKVPSQEIGWFNPWLDIAAARHETADARMFIS